MAQPVIIYIESLSAPSLAVISLALLNNIKHEVKEVAPSKGGNLNPEFKEISPFGVVPAINDNGFKLYGGHAVLRYLCDTKEVSSNWYPKDPKERAIVDSYLDWHRENTEKCSIYFTTYYAHTMPRTYFFWDATEMKKLTIKALYDLENVFLKDSQYITSNNEMSIADLSAACVIIQIRVTKINFEKLPKVSKWLEECMKCPELQKANKGVMNFIGRSTAKLHL